MFTVTVTERGEPSETLTFDKLEVTIGRVRGNDIVLRKGSVSKRHAKILRKDDKFVAVDLKSTNGTIVNGRKITAPQVLRESDKLVVGDYVIEVAAAARPHLPTGPQTEAVPAAPPPPPERLGGHTASSPHPAAASESDEPRPEMATRERPRPMPDPTDGAISISGFEPHSTESLAPTGAPKKHTTLAMRVPQSLFRDAGPVSRSPRSRDLPPSVYAEGFANSHNAALRAVLHSVSADDLPTAYPPSEEERTRIERAVRLAVPTTDGFVDSGEILDVLVNELTGLGPLEYYLDDPDVSEIHVNRYDAVFIRSRGVLKPAPLCFGAADTLMATARRIALGAQIDDPIGGAVRLPDGTRVELIMPPASSGGPVLSIVKPIQSVSSSTDLITSGAASAAIVSALQTAVANGGSVLVSSPRAADATHFVNAIIADAAGTRRVVAVENVPSLQLSGRNTVRLENVPFAEPSTLQRAATLEPDVLVVDPFGGDMVVDWLLDVASAHSGFVATFGARNASDAVSRLVLMALQGRASDVTSIRRQLACSLDLLVQLRRHDGELVVGEVMELAGVEQDGLQTVTVFQSKVGPAGLEFTATGHVPRFFTELSAAGVEFDTTVFNT